MCIISFERLGYLTFYLLLHVQLLFKTFSSPVKGHAGRFIQIRGFDGIDVFGFNNIIYC